MIRVFADKAVLPNELFKIEGEDAAHLSFSLRAKKGEALTLVFEGMEYPAVIAGFSKNTVTVLPGEGRAAGGEPAVDVTLYVGLPKGDKLELIVQKAVELGASRVVPFVAERSVVQPNPRKIERLRRVAREAAAPARCRKS